MAARARLTGTGTSNLTKTMRARDLARDPDSELCLQLSECVDLSWLYIKGWFVYMKGKRIPVTVDEYIPDVRHFH